MSSVVVYDIEDEGVDETTNYLQVERSGNVVFVPFKAMHVLDCTASS